MSSHWPVHSPRHTGAPLWLSPQQTAVEEWVQSYKEDRELALLDLISFFVQCCGCEGEPGSWTRAGVTPLGLPVPSTPGCKRDWAAGLFQRLFR